MPDKHEHIYKRKDGRWEGRYRSGTDSSGAAVYRSVYGQSNSEVRMKLFFCDKSDNSADYMPKSTLLFGDVISLWQKANANHCKGATVLKYENLITNHILPELGGYRLADIDTFVLADFMDNKLMNGRLDQTGGLSASYVRSIMRIVFEVIDFAAEENMCEPLKAKTKIRKPALERREFDILDIRSQARLEKQLFLSPNETAAGILISLNTGLRLSEICALKWSDIDFENAILHVRTTVARVRNTGEGSKTKLIIDRPKTKSSFRDIPISSYLMKMLVSLYEKRKSEYVVSDQEGFISPRTYSYRFHKVLEKYNVKQVNYHALRHTFATRCIEHGVDVKTLSEILGHSNASITLNTYVHSSMERKREQLEKLTMAI